MTLRTLLSISLLLFATGAHAEYIGLEPDRLTHVLELENRADATDEALARAFARAAAGDWAAAESGFRKLAQTDTEARLGWAVSLFHLERKDEALEAVESGSDTPKLRYARVLLRLHADPDVSFEELRSELVALGLENGERFDLWLALNPSEEELEAYLSRLAERDEPLLRWQRAELYLRLDEAEKARAEVRGAASIVKDPLLRNHMDLAHARALFQLGSDRAGQDIYQGLLERLEPSIAARLYRDLASIATDPEREDYRARELETKKEFFRRFWARRHPLPTRDVNPRLSEHYRRLARALREFPLQSTGRGYFTDRDVFLEFSPKLRYYDSSELFEQAHIARYWVDHRGLILLRHGPPDRAFPERHYGGSDENTSWLVSRFQAQPLAFHFVKRPVIGEWVLALNLGVAATKPQAPDEPREVLSARTRDLGRVYSSRRGFLPMYRQILDARSLRDVADGLVAESNQMAAFVRASLSRDTTSFYTRANTIPMLVSVSNFYSEGQSAIQVDFAADLEVLEEDEDKLGPDSELVATLLAFDREWNELLRREERRFPLGELPEGDSKVYLGAVQLYDVDPREYRLVLELRQPDTGRIGLSRGRHVPGYLPPEHLGLSDLFLQVGADRREQGWQAAPARIVDDKQPVRVQFELYNPKPDASGLARYEVEERVLTLYKEPGFWSQLASVGTQVAGGFFPLYTFAANVGGFFVSQAIVNDDAGLDVSQRVVERPAEPSLTESFQMDLTELDKGIHTIYVTVRDLVTGEITSRFLTIRVS